MNNMSSSTKRVTRMIDTTDSDESEVTNPQATYSSLEAMLEDLVSFIEQNVSENEDDESSSDENDTDESSSDENDKLILPTSWSVDIVAGQGSYNFKFDYGGYGYDWQVDDEKSMSSKAQYDSSESLCRDVETLRKFFARYEQTGKVRFDYSIIANGGEPFLSMSIYYNAYYPKYDQDEEDMKQAVRCMNACYEFVSMSLTATMSVMFAAYLMNQNSVNIYLGII